MFKWGEQGCFSCTTFFPQEFLLTFCIFFFFFLTEITDKGSDIEKKRVPSSFIASYPMEKLCFFRDFKCAHSLPERPVM